MALALAGLRDKMSVFVKKSPYGQYTALPENVSQAELDKRSRVWAARHRALIKITLSAMLLTAVALFLANLRRSNAAEPCDAVEAGFQCEADISHSWGQYSPFFTVPSTISASVPGECEITFAQVLSRHGARDPTAGKTASYAALVDKIHSNVTEYSKAYEFIKNYEYTLGADQLTVFGQQQLVNSGIKFYQRYEKLARTISPYVRSAGQERVVESALNWTQGFHQARLSDKNSKSPDTYPYDILVIPEASTSNNTLSPDTCTSFKEGTDYGSEAQDIWAGVFTPKIAERVNKNLSGVNLTSQEIIYLMDLCPFNTVADTQGQLSPFCSLFTVEEWNDYDYYLSLGMWYRDASYTDRDALGPTQGVGFVNELIARLTSQPVVDHTTTNTTLDSANSTFPLGSVLYADFSHDNDMVTMFSAMGLYNTTESLSKTTRQSVEETNGFSASWVVPFAARMYVEKLSCTGQDEELVRVLVNDRVIPLQNCGADEEGRCTVSRFVDSLTFATGGGHWDLCYE
ncbi:histidine phosphatase superfamily [Biscogniauxia sp. FL1348]|nr:histidine phosphatase superfamily [Biscogniauxia sp. FL1348]